MENRLGMYSRINELNPAALGAGQAAADAEMQKQDDQNGVMVDNASMDVVAENPKEQIGVGYVAKTREPATSNLDQYIDTLERHDWQYALASDRRLVHKGMQEIDILKKIYKSLNDIDKQRALDIFKDMYLQYWNTDDYPRAEQNVKYLTVGSFSGYL